MIRDTLLHHPDGWSPSPNVRGGVELAYGTNLSAIEREPLTGYQIRVISNKLEPGEAKSARKIRVIRIIRR